MPVQVGIDLVRTDEVRGSLAAHGERYLNRIYTEAERRDAGANPRRLAARFAAKEATIKALGPGAAESLPWRAIGVRQDSTGGLSIELTQEAAALAQSLGVRRIEVSLAYRGSVAAAIVVAELEGGMGGRHCPTS
jgi:holo-[acyl-carrier protein] synthase